MTLLDLGQKIWKNRFSVLLILVLIFGAYHYRGKIYSFSTSAVDSIFSYIEGDQKQEQVIHDPELVKTLNQHVALITQLQDQVKELEKSNADLKAQVDQLAGLKPKIDQLQKEFSSFESHHKSNGAKPGSNPRKSAGNPPARSKNIPTPGWEEETEPEAP